MRIQTSTIDVVIEGEYQYDIFMKFIEQYPEERNNPIIKREIVEYPTPWTVEELLEHHRQGHV